VLAALLRLLVLVVGALPRRALATLGGAVGFVAGSLLRIRRTHVEEAMRAAGIADPGPQSRAMYAALGTSALELIGLGARRVEGAAGARMDAPSAALWRRARALGRGVVVAASHTGNWDVAACAMAGQVELLVVTKRLRVRALDDLWQSTRAARGVQLADGDGVLARAREVLGRGGAVAMMIDQVPPRRRQSVRASFLGRPVLVDRAPAALAAASGAPLVVAAGFRAPDGEQELRVLAVLRPPPRRSRAGRGGAGVSPEPGHGAATGRWIVDATIAATGALDRFVRDHPSQWLWLHRRWRQLDPASPGAMLDAP
jgi:Kdo2-lipid IVA lauroyltransferase/acyltransferase